jgi:peptidase C39-like protein
MGGRSRSRRGEGVGDGRTLGLAFRQAYRLGPVLIALLAPYSLAGEERGSRSGETSGGAEWRRPENDGLNCLFLQLHYLGYQGHYESFYNTTRGKPGLDRLSGLSAAAKALGFDLVPARLAMTELEEYTGPTLVHLEQQGSVAGFYGLVKGFEDQKVLLIHGGKASLERIPRDVFRREWSGFALVPQDGIEWGPRIRRGLAALMVGCALVIIGNRVLVRRSQRDVHFPGR